MAEDKQSRDWMLTIRAKGHTTDDVKAFFERIASGAVFQQERGKTGYWHFQCFMQLASPMRWTTLKGHLAKSGFADAHFEPRKGSVADCMRYCTKRETRIGEPVYVGKLHLRDQQGARNDLHELREQILAGASVDDVLLGDEKSRAARYTKWLADLAAARDRKRFGEKMRELTVHYVWGAPGVGKTRFVYDSHPIGDIYRITDYKHPFDEYDGQDVLVLDEYDSQFDWEKLLCYLDRYPLTLPARYHNHQAAYTKVYILSNKPLKDQYPLVSGSRRMALIRRLTDCRHMVAGGEMFAEPLPGRVSLIPSVQPAESQPCFDDMAIVVQDEVTGDEHGLDELDQLSKDASHEE